MKLQAGVDWVIVEKLEDKEKIYLPDDTKFMEALAVPARVISTGPTYGPAGLESPHFKEGDTVLVSLVGSIRIRREQKVYYALRHAYVIAIVKEEEYED